jgi:hypothetical protein
VPCGGANGYRKMTEEKTMAINDTWSQLGQQYLHGDCTKNTESGKLAARHYADLLTEQLRRAKCTPVGDLKSGSIHSPYWLSSRNKPDRTSQIDLGTIPHDVIMAEHKLSSFFTDRNVKDWSLGRSSSRSP